MFFLESNESFTRQDNKTVVMYCRKLTTCQTAYRRVWQVNSVSKSTPRHTQVLTSRIRVVCGTATKASAANKADASTLSALAAEQNRQHYHALHEALAPKNLEKKQKPGADATGGQ